MIDKFRASVFGWPVPPAAVHRPAPVLQPVQHPETAFLQAVNAPSFVELGHDAERRMEAGLPPGLIERVGITQRAKSYASAVEAGADFAINEVRLDVEAAERVFAERCAETPRDHYRVLIAGETLDRERARLAVAEKYAPLASRWTWRNRLRELDAAPPRQTRVERLETAVLAVEPEPRPAVVWSIDEMTAPGASERRLRAARERVEAQQREDARARFVTMQRGKVDGLRRVDIDDPIAERLDLRAKLTAWNERFPELARELAAFG